MLDAVENLDDYLRRYGRDLAGNIVERAEPLYTPGDEWDPRLYGMGKRPYQAQGDAIMAVSRLLGEAESALVVGEMGCGKTLIGLSIPYVHGSAERPNRTLVMCPGHLVNKWVREATETIPDAEGYIIDGLGDVLDLDPSSHPDRPEYLVVSKERAKLGYAWEPAVIERRDGYCCPRCAELVVDRDGIPVDYAYLDRNRRFCGECAAPLWQADNSRVRRYPIADYVKQHLRGYFDFFIADEVHELKGGDTAQGNAFGALASACGKTVALTGTLLGGYADDIFYVLYRLDPTKMQEEGLGYGEVGKWMGRYGVLERVTKYTGADNVFSRGRKSGTRIKRKPGISPGVFSRHLMDRAVFLDLEDIADDLPSLSEEAEGIRMSDELEAAYRELEDDLTEAMRAALTQGDKSLLGTYVNALLSYPDRPFGYEPLVHPHTGDLIAKPRELPQDEAFPKEERLLELIRGSLDDDRGVFAYCQYTGKRDVTERLHGLLLDEGIRSEVLTASVKPADRESWLSDRTDAGVRVVIGNPRLVQTGLDLYEFPTLVFYQTGYSIYSLRQASRRSWRIGQDRDVQVHYLYYRPTMQERAMQLMGKKLEASLAVEGKFSEQGLLAMTQGEDMTTALARALVDGLEGEGVEDMWSRMSGREQDDAPPSYADGLLFYVDPVNAEKRVRKRRHRSGVSSDEQLSLFGE